MKRVVAIGLLFIFSFNVGGYYLLFWGLQSVAKRQLALQIENNDLEIETQYQFKIPIILPYPLQETGFVPASGTFEHEGELYTLIRQKYENDTLHVICIRDSRQNQLHTALNEYQEKSNDVAAPQGKGIQLTKLTGEFEDITGIGICTGNSWSIQQTFLEPTCLLSTGYLSRYSPPPDSTIC